MNVNLLQERFVANVRQLLADQDIRQSELARRMGVTRSAVSQYMVGSMSPGLNVVTKFSKALGCKDPLDLLQECAVRV